eukprot:3010268-Amphidinium_carterae.1
MLCLKFQELKDAFEFNGLHIFVLMVQTRSESFFVMAHNACQRKVGRRSVPNTMSKFKECLHGAGKLVAGLV